MKKQNSYTEPTTESWNSQLMGSATSVFLGIIVFLGSFLIIWWNEDQAVKTSEGLEGTSQVTITDSKSIDNSQNGKLVYVSGLVKTDDTLKDEEFGVAIIALKLRRVVEMYQWQEVITSEKKTNAAGQEETISTFNYEKGWSRKLNNSDGFKVTKNHGNPASFPYEEFTKEADDVTIGTYNMPPSLLSKVHNFQPYAINQISPGTIKGALFIHEENANLPDGVKITEKIFIGEGTSRHPAIGDTKVSFQIVKPGNYSLIAQQTGHTFEKYVTSTGSAIERISPGVQPSESMFIVAQKTNLFTTSGVRLLGILIMFVGLNLVFKPLVFVVDELPFFGTLLDGGLTFFSGIVSFTLSLTTIAATWVYYRPVTGISLGLLALGSFTFFYIRSAQKGNLVPR